MYDEIYHLVIDVALTVFLLQLFHVNLRHNLQVHKYYCRYLTLRQSFLIYHLSIFLYLDDFLQNLNHNINQILQDHTFNDLRVLKVL